MAQGDVSMLDQSMSQLTSMMFEPGTGPKKMTWEELEEVRPKYAKFTTMRAFGTTYAELVLAIKKAGLDWEVFSQM